MIKKVLFVGMACTVVFLLVQLQVMSQQLLTIRDVYNRVWDKASSRLMTTPWAGAQQGYETETTILNNVYDATNRMLRTSGGGAGSDIVNPMTTAGDTIVATTGGIAARLPLASQMVINVKAPPYNAVGDGVVDDTAAIQAALDDALVLNPAATPNGAGTVYLPPGTYSITQIDVPTPVLLEGANMFHGSKLVQVDGVNGDAVRLKCRDDDGWFYGGVRHLHIEKKQPVTDTLGSGIGVTRTTGNCSLGETTRLSELRIRGFPVAGIQVLQGSAPLRITHVSTFANGQFGIDLRGQHQTVVLDLISGDSNNVALINVDGTGSTYDATAIHIRNVKAETNTLYPAPAGPQETVVLLNTLTNARVTLDNISATAGTGAVPQEIVRIKGARAVVTRVRDVACSGGCTNLLVDEINSFSMAWGSDIQELLYRGNGTYQVEGRAGYSLHSIAIGQSQPAQVGTTVGGVLTQKAASNGVTLQTLTRQQDSAPTGSFVKYQTLAGTDVWDVGITGVLVTGVVPVTRLQEQVLDQADTASIAVDCGLYNHVRVDELSQATTFTAPVGCTPIDGKEIDIAVFSTTARALTFVTTAGGFSAAYGVALPTTSFAGQWVFYSFKWNSILARWVIVRATR